jgi:hypothetical protein
VVFYLLEYQANCAFLEDSVLTLIIVFAQQMPTPFSSAFSLAYVALLAIG